jgi:glyoxylase-like metal-dependent hydrolase (beta-lactamase superfamily II)
VTVDWFGTQRLREGVHIVSEPMHVNSYLIVGSKRAVLLDTGLGIQSIRRCVEALTDMPILVVNTHHHFDHVGGNHEFEDIAIHESGGASLEKEQPAWWFPAYLEFVELVMAQYKTFREIDETWFQVLAQEMQMRPLPEGFDGSSWRTIPSIPSQLLKDDDVLDLGDRSLRVLHTPGHTPDSICLLDEKHRILYSGDTVDTGPIYAQFSNSDIDAFATSARRLVTDIAGSVDTVLSAHGARYHSYPDILGRVADAFDDVRYGRASFTPGEDCFRTPVKQALFNDFSVVVAADYAPKSAS